MGNGKWEHGMCSETIMATLISKHKSRKCGPVRCQESSQGFCPNTCAATQVQLLDLLQGRKSLMHLHHARAILQYQDVCCLRIRIIGTEMLQLYASHLRPRLHAISNNHTLPWHCIDLWRESLKTKQLLMILDFLVRQRQLQCVSCHPCMSFYIGFDGCKSRCLVALNHAQQITSLYIGARS